MADHKEPRIGSLEESQPLESLGATTEDGGVQQKRSWGGVASALSHNRPALLLIGAVAVMGGVFLYQKASRPVDDSTNTSVLVAPPSSEEGRSGDSTRVSGLDEKVEDQALATAQETGGTYIPPLSPLPPPEVPKAPPPPPNPPQVPASNAAGNTQQAQERQEQKRLEDSLMKQLDAIAARVDGDSAPMSEAVTLDTSALLAKQSSNQVQQGGQSQGAALGYPMGTVWKATLVTGADTDRPGTVQAVIEEGPFAGRTALCNFTWPSREYINLECFAVRLDKESLPVSMVAVGPDEMPNLKADYNGRYIQRLGTMFLVGLPAAYAEGLARGGTTVVSAGGTTQTQDPISGTDLLIYAGGKATEPLLEEAQQIAREIKPQAKVPPMQLIGLMLAEDI
jgi:hypothetical protein